MLRDWRLTSDHNMVHHILHTTPIPLVGSRTISDATRFVRHKVRSVSWRNVDDARIQQAQLAMERDLTRQRAPEHGVCKMYFRIKRALYAGMDALPRMSATKVNSGSVPKVVETARAAATQAWELYSWLQTQAQQAQQLRHDAEQNRDQQQQQSPATAAAAAALPAASPVTVSDINDNSVEQARTQAVAASEKYKEACAWFAKRRFCCEGATTMHSLDDQPTELADTDAWRAYQRLTSRPGASSAITYGSGDTPGDLAH